MVYLQSIIPQRLHISVQIRCQIDFVDHTDVRLQEDMRIFQRLVIPFGGTDDNDFLRFSQIEHGRTNKITDILHKQDGAVGMDSDA